MSQDMNVFAPEHVRIPLGSNIPTWYILVTGGLIVLKLGVYVETL